ncbi:MAG: hypothetical protein JWP48_4144 [Actinoallomurus sp.]|jgi:hypothetical protein|nr:hypothetical protein [Actinoallomurus sp.]
MRTGATPATMLHATVMRTRALHGLITPARFMPGVAMRTATVHPFALLASSTPAHIAEGGDKRAGGLRYGQCGKPNPEILNA